MTGGKNISDKIEEKRGNISPMINLRFGARALPLNPERKQNVSAVVELYSHLPPLTDIKWGPRPDHIYFNGGSSEIQKDFLAPDFYLNSFWGFFSFFYSIK